MRDRVSIVRDSADHHPRRLGCATPPNFSVRDFGREHDVIFIAEAKPESFLQSIEHALSVKQDEAIGARRRAVAALADWDKRLSRMSSLIEDQLRTK